MSFLIISIAPSSLQAISPLHRLSDVQASNIKSTTEIADDCDFLIIKAIYLGNDQYEICGESIGQLYGFWTIDYNGSTIGSGTGTSFCSVVTAVGSGGFTVCFKLEGTDTDCCQIIYIDKNINCPINVLPSTMNCDNNICVGSAFGNFAIVSFDNGPATTLNDGCFTVPANATEICITYYSASEMLTTCCYPVPSYDCCLTADFGFTKNILSTSCLNPIYSMVPVCAKSGNNQHTWVFSDGTTYNGVQPPDHMFSNFVVDNNQVCVTHTVTCCDEEISVTKCLQHDNGAYLGKPGEDTYLTTAIPAPWGPNAKAFIDKYSIINIPLFIDGRLIVNINASFTEGVWNMGFESSILVKTYSYSPATSFGLDAVTIQSPVRLNPVKYAGCCRWDGIRSEGRTLNTYTNSRITDSKTMLYFPPSQSITFPPRISFVGNTFENNQTCISSDGQYFRVLNFHDNDIVGRVVPLICGCTCNNAIDLKNIGVPMTDFKNTGAVNNISNYEQAFHAENSNLKIRNFNLFQLEDCFNENNSSDDDGIGVYFEWGLPNNSLLNIDQITFDDMGTGVKDFIMGVSNHSLTAIASTPYTSLSFDNVFIGYNLIIEQAKANTKIIHNTINTNGGNQNHGIIGSFLQAQDNIFDIHRNLLSNSGGNVNSTGISFGNSAALPQDINVLQNNVTVNGTAIGAAISIYNTSLTQVEHNVISSSSNKSGVELTNSAQSILKCNNINYGKNAMEIFGSGDLEISGNNVFSSSLHGLNAISNCSGVNGTNIFWNDYEFIFPEAVFYEKKALVGKQYHTQYNRWILPQTGLELVQPNPFLANQYWYPSNAPSGSIHRPLFNIPLMIPAPNANIQLETAAFCALPGPCTNCPTPPGMSVPGDQRYSDFISDTANMTGLNLVERTQLRQSVYELLIQNPTWLTSQSVLNNFYTSYTAGFVGKSKTIQNLMNTMSANISSQITSQSTLRNQLDNIQSTIDSIYLLADQTTDPLLLSSLLNQVTLLTGQKNTIEQSLVSQQTSFNTTNATALNGLISLNNQLPASGINETNEKFVNTLTLKHLSHQSLSQSEQTDLINIANTCNSITGNAGAMARNLCLIAMGKYIPSPDCNQAPQNQSRKSGNVLGTVKASPNPANQELTIQLGTEWSNEPVDIMVYDLLGSPILSQKNSTLRTNLINTSLLAPGQYYLTISNASQTETIKFVVNH